MASKLKTRIALAAASSLAVLIATQPSNAADESPTKSWWPFPIYDSSSGTPKDAEYTPLDKAEKPYNICVLFPHMKDSFWVAVAYGIVQQAKAEHVNMNLYEAGGYENLPKQISQFDDCMASGADAIVIGAITGAAFKQKFAEAKAKGIPVVGVTNPMPKDALPAANYVDFVDMGSVTAKGLIANLGKDEEANVVTFPGPAGSGWAEDFEKGFEETVKDQKNIKILDKKFGDSGVAVQLRLVQDALQTYPNMNVIWGTAPTAEAAIGAVQLAGRPDMKIISSYENQAMLDALNNGQILAFATQYPVAEGAIAIDQAVRLLEKKPVIKLVQPKAKVIDQNNVKSLNMDLVLAPTDWNPEYSVTAK
ncbi:TMAO reductase system periplasmic protein TorT [Jiella sp. MQZ9-1]|uniref:TMAO reductase system periplasmic protein TorT n=1 Tax=Jiella flava TaxID=2816857 RepID=A0A939FYB4_9HYPH|nr:TMAO reductase system periplasmic protein TorT [Jiella flava]MBO0663114.1 TMAO reductase system periplasmic protein TorT [Jiella flava]MCD2471533.1 TMAO reductase system periplasmic protein TorT [Jiella flava]